VIPGKQITTMTPSSCVVFLQQTVASNELVTV
jgi:hypothetical protein